MNTIENISKNHYIAIIGGSVSGSEAAAILAQKGYKVVVFDQNKLPYGKLEDGLPMWHSSLRDRQEDAIDEKLDHPNITYIPLIQIGKDVSFSDLANEWGFSAIILANGAWNDRQLSLQRIHDFLGKKCIKIHFYIGLIISTKPITMELIIKFKIMQWF